MAGCAPIPFGHPHAAVTSGAFHLKDGATLPYRLYPADGPTNIVLLALHGYTDSRDFFAIPAPAFNRAGVTIYAPDQSSFGATANRGIWPGTAVFVEEARDMAVQLRARYPHTKLFVFGESMGGAVTLLLGASDNPPPVDGYILSSPAVWGGPAMSPVLKLALRVAVTTVPAKRLTGQSAHVLASDNIQALIALGQDPLTIGAPRVDHLAGLVAMMAAAQAACGQFHAPHALFLYGGHDELIPPEAARRCWRALPAHVTLAYYPPDYHLIERDYERAVPIADILGFMQGTGLTSDAPSQATVFLAAP